MWFSMGQLYLMLSMDWCHLATKFHRPGRRALVASPRVTVYCTQAMKQEKIKNKSCNIVGIGPELIGLCSSDKNGPKFQN